MTDEAPRAGTGRVVVAMILVAVAVIAWLVATRTDITVWQDFHRDVIVRDAYRADEIADIRFYDASPYSIWLPSDLFVRDSIRNGELPLWDRRQAGGYSPLLNVQNGVLHPIRWLPAITPRESTPSVLLVLELLTLATGTFVLLRSGLMLSTTASILGALFAAFCGNTLSFAHFSGALLPLAHAPWILWAYFRWAGSRRLEENSDRRVILSEAKDLGKAMIRVHLRPDPSLRSG